MAQEFARVMHQGMPARAVSERVSRFGEVIGSQLVHGDDLVIGEIVELGSYVVEAEEMVAFAQAWDPQDFHIDVESAEAGPFGGLIASGVQTLAIFQRLLVLRAFRTWAVVAGRAIRNMDLPSPVRPGMKLDAAIQVVEVAHVRPDRSLVGMIGTLEASGQRVLTLEFDVYVRRRPSPIS